MNTTTTTTKPKPITASIENQARFGLIEGPVWTDCCHHPEESYVASFVVCKRPDKIDRFDLYVYTSKYSGGQDVCLRYGDGCSEYISPGPLGDFLTRNDHEPYTSAIRILLHFGRVSWTRDSETQ